MLRADKEVKAKDVSLIGQIVGALWVAGFSAYKFIKGEFEITEVILSGIAIASCFSPVYFSILMDKVKEIKMGGKE